MKPIPKPAALPTMRATNPAERWFDARADRAKARQDARRGPLFEREAPAPHRWHAVGLLAMT